MLLSAEQLIQLVKEKYATCWSYKDSGLAFSRDFVVEFETSFVRPDRFSFRWRDTESNIEKLIHFENDKVVLNLQEEHLDIANLQDAISMASASSLLASSLLASLLLKELVLTRVDFLPLLNYEMTESEHEGRTLTLLSSEPHPDLIQKFRIDPEELVIYEWEQLVKADSADRTYLQMENFLVSQTDEVKERDSEIGTRIAFKHVLFNE